MMRLLNMLGSRKIGWVLTLGLIGAYLWLSFDGDAPMARWLHLAFHEPLGVALWLGLAVNLLLRALWLIADRLHPMPPAIAAMDNLVVVSAGEGFGDWLRGHFAIEIVEGETSARRGRLSALPGVSLRIGAVIAMVALLASAHIRVEETTRLTLLRSGSLLGKEITLTALEPGLPENYLDTGDGAAFSLNNPEATLHRVGHSFTLHEGYPFLADGTYYRMTDVGFYQSIRVGDGPNTMEVGGNLDVLPPGRAENILVSSFDATLNVKLAPVSKIQKGLITGDVYDMVKPSYTVSVKCGTNEVETATLKGGQSKVMAGVSLAFGEPGMSVEVLAVRDPALWLFGAGMWLLMAGLVLMPLRIIWYVKEVRVEVGDETARVGYSEEFFRKWARVRFETWVRERGGVAEKLR